MKRILYLCILVLFASCDDSYVDILPKGKTIPENTDDLAMLLNSTYEINTGGDNYMNQSDDVVIPDDQVAFATTAVMNAYTWQDYIYSEGEQDEDWSSFYKIISRANFVLQNLDTYTVGKEYDVEYTKGRALFLRANAYFYLVNGYGKHYDASTASSDLAVPLLLEMDVNESEPRSTVQKVYDQIISDLETAIPLLTETSPYRTWANKAAAYALLGRVYLYQEQYELSQEYSKKALDFYSVLTDYNTLSFVSGTNSAQGVSGYNPNYTTNEESVFVQKGSYRSNFYLSDELINTFDKANDLRYRYFTSDYDQTGAYLDGKHIMTTSASQTWSGISVPEVILNYCEALMKQGTPNSGEAVNYLNLLRKNRFDAATYSDFASSNNQVVLDEIMLERRRELRLTAWRWFDMKRLGLSVNRTVKGETYALTGNSNNYVWAIPLNVMVFNKNLVQNPRGL